MKLAKMALAGAVAWLSAAGLALAADPAPAGRAPEGCEWRAPDAASEGRHPLFCRGADGKMVKAQIGSQLVPGVFERADAGDVDAMGLVVNFYVYSVPENLRDPKVAFDWAKRAADKGSPDGKFELGRMYMQGTVTPRNEALGLRLVREGAEDDGLAQLILGTALIEGQWGTTDKAEGLRWMRRAADGGLEPAMWQLGLMYERGLNGLAVDHRQAEAWYRKAVASGTFWPAMFELCDIILTQNRAGQGGDPAEAFRWCMKAHKAGDTRADSVIGQQYLLGWGVERDDAEGARWIRRGAEAGRPYDMAVLGDLYIKGRGVPQNRELGVEWLRKAAAEGEPNAIRILKELGINHTA